MHPAGSYLWFAALTAIDILKRHEPAALEALAGSIRALGDEVVTERVGATLTR